MLFIVQKDVSNLIKVTINLDVPMMLNLNKKINN